MRSNLLCTDCNFRCPCSSLSTCGTRAFTTGGKPLKLMCKPASETPTEYIAPASDMSCSCGPISSPSILEYNDARTMSMAGASGALVGCTARKSTLKDASGEPLGMLLVQPSRYQSSELAAMLLEGRTAAKSAAALLSGAAPYSSSSRVLPLLLACAWSKFSSELMSLMGGGVFGISLLARATSPLCNSAISSATTLSLDESLLSQPFHLEGAPGITSAKPLTP
mmetsp:Transcript_53764/g.128104  ORF Transcript_53764/g.128104 Transcript_53764/m.128104 type:complete len:224 (-) Transcript_53764:1833-2504(-)